MIFFEHIEGIMSLTIFYVAVEKLVTSLTVALSNTFCLFSADLKFFSLRFSALLL